MTETTVHERGRMAELARYFLRLGFLGFGGPVALVGQMERELAKLGMEDWLQWAIAAVCFVVTIILQAEVALLFIGAGIIGIIYYGKIAKRPPVALSIAVIPAAAPAIAPVATGSTLGKLLLFF